MIKPQQIPLSLYVHFPWCLSKCHYCDFNSYAAPDIIPESTYLEKLLLDLEQTSNLIPRKLQSIFFGGGTPSLLSTVSIAKIIKFAEINYGFADDIEITLEANPGTVDFNKCRELQQIGINRISLGVQSFDDEHLVTLGRIHNSQQALAAISAIKQAGFNNFNLDLMYGLPKQSSKSALSDLLIAFELEPTHISWYQLTVEPGTKFFVNQIKTINDESVLEIEQLGRELLAKKNYQHYEISAYAKPNFQCKHNLNYWQFGDYIGIGPGAHSKFTVASQIIMRNRKISDPEKYLQVVKFNAEEKAIAQHELPFEFMLNALRLYNFIPFSLFTARTGLKANVIAKQLKQASKMGLIKIVTVPENGIVTTTLGKNFLNDLLELFLLG